MKPNPYLRDRMIGIYARAQELYGMEVFAVVALSNHTQDLIAPRSAQQRTAWLRHTGTNLSKLIKRHRNWDGPVFPRRATVVPCTDELPSFVDRLQYILAHGLKEGLTPHPGLWLGMECVSSLCAGKMEVEGVWCDRTGYSRAVAAWRRERARLQMLGRHHRHTRPRIEDFERVVQLKLSKPAEFSEWSDERYCAWVRSQVDEILEEFSQERAGVPENWKEMLERTRFDERPRSKQRRRPPLCHAASREARQEFQARWRDWMNSYLAASRAWCSGNLSVAEEFPEGAILPRLDRSEEVVIIL